MTTTTPQVPADVLTGEDVVRALSLARTGRVFDLDCTRFTGMPLFPGHPPFQVLNFRTPRGIRNQGDQTWLGDNAVEFRWHSDYVMGTVHTGTHIDALSHVTCGADDHFFGGLSSTDTLGDHGPLRFDAAEIRPLLTRGVLIDVPGAKGVTALAAHEEIGRADLEQALEKQGVELRSGDVALVRTGYLSAWPDPERLAQHVQAGINLEAAEFLLEQQVVAVGGDTESLERLPSTVEGNPHPVHVRLMIESGVYILEMVYLEELARERCYEFLFVCLPLKIQGATGSMVRPVAVI